MITDFNFTQYAATFPLSEADLIEHIIKKFHPDTSVRQSLILKHNLTLILHATFKLSHKMSFSKMTVRDLQKETDISMGTLYNTFGSKEDLEKMIVTGVHYLTVYTNKEGKNLKIDESRKLALTLKSYVYLGRIFKSWYYFINMDFRTMTQDSLNTVIDTRMLFISELSSLMNNNLAASSHLSTIIQDFIIRDWKYASVDIDDFAEHCIRLAHLLNDHSEALGDLPIKIGS